MAGKATLRSSIPELIIQFPAQFEELGRASAERIVATAHQLSPKDTGSLDKTIEAKKMPGKPHAWAAVAGDRAGGYTGRDTRSHGVVSYAAVQEFGGAHTPPHPFMGPAARQEIQRAPGQMMKSLWVFFGQHQVSRA